MVNVASHSGIDRPATMKPSVPPPAVLRVASQPIAMNDAYISPIASSAMPPHITLFYVTITYNHVMATTTATGQDNPFVYGEIVSAAAFADRDDERERLRRDLASGQKVFLISPRRYGKSSLVRDVMRGLARKKILTVEVTVAASSSYIGFLESYARALVAADTPAGRLKRWAGELFRAIKPEVRIDTDPLGKAGF